MFHVLKYKVKNVKLFSIKNLISNQFETFLSRHISVGLGFHHFGWHIGLLTTPKGNGFDIIMNSV